MTLYISTSDANGVIFGSGVEFGLLFPRARALIIVRALTLVRGWPILFARYFCVRFLLR